MIIEFEESLHSIPSLMSAHCDRILRRTKHSWTCGEIETGIPKLMESFSFLSAKNEFHDLYQHQLSACLLNESSASYEAEKRSIQRLEMECGDTSTYKLEGMLTDLALAHEMNTHSHESNEFQQLAGNHEPVDPYSYRQIYPFR